MNTEKQTDLQVLDLTSDWHITLLVKGHVDHAVMREACAKERAGDLVGFGEPIHTWWRTFPKWVDGVRTRWYQQAEPHTRGAFRCTVMVKDW
jgi:hypothetical protein